MNTIHEENNKLNEKKDNNHYIVVWGKIVSEFFFEHEKNGVKYYSTQMILCCASAGDMENTIRIRTEGVMPWLYGWKLPIVLPEKLIDFQLEYNNRYICAEGEVSFSGNLMEGEKVAINVGSCKALGFDNEYGCEELQEIMPVNFLGEDYSIMNFSCNTITETGKIYKIISSPKEMGKFDVIYFIIVSEDENGNISYMPCEYYFGEEQITDKIVEGASARVTGILWSQKDERQFLKFTQDSLMNSLNEEEKMEYDMEPEQVKCDYCINCTCIEVY